MGINTIFTKTLGLSLYREILGYVWVESLGVYRFMEHKRIVNSKNLSIVRVQAISILFTK